MLIDFYKTYYGQEPMYKMIGSEMHHRLKNKYLDRIEYPWAVYCDKDHVWVPIPYRLKKNV